jgi:hypothetical protein
MRAPTLTTTTMRMRNLGSKAGRVSRPKKPCGDLRLCMKPRFLHATVYRHSPVAIAAAQQSRELARSGRRDAVLSRAPKNWLHQVHYVNCEALCPGLSPFDSPALSDGAWCLRAFTNAVHQLCTRPGSTAPVKRLVFVPLTDSAGRRRTRTRQRAAREVNDNSSQGYNYIIRVISLRMVPASTPKQSDAQSRCVNTRAAGSRQNLVMSLFKACGTSSVCNFDCLRSGQ